MEGEPRHEAIYPPGRGWAGAGRESGGCARLRPGARPVLRDEAPRDSQLSQLREWGCFQPGGAPWAPDAASLTPAGRSRSGESARSSRWALGISCPLRRLIPTPGATGLNPRARGFIPSQINRPHAGVWASSCCDIPSSQPRHSRRECSQGHLPPRAPAAGWGRSRDGSRIPVLPHPQLPSLRFPAHSHLCSAPRATTGTGTSGSAPGMPMAPGESALARR